MTPVEIARQVISLRPPISHIVRDVCGEFGVAEGDVYDSRRDADTTLARHTSWYACYQAGHSYSAIAKAFGRDHTSVLNGCKRIGAKIGQR